MSDEQVKGIQRYDVVFRVDDEGEGYRKVKDVNGAYVLFKDHEQALAALEARLAAREKPLDQWNEVGWVGQRNGQRGSRP